MYLYKNLSDHGFKLKWGMGRVTRFYPNIKYFNNDLPYHSRQNPFFHKKIKQTKL